MSGGPAPPPPATARIPVRSPEDVWTFTQRNVPLWDILEFFPGDAIGPRGPKDPPRPYEVKPITIETDLGWSFETDIQYGAWVFRPRGPKQPGMMRWCRESGLEPGDAIVFERLDERRFPLKAMQRVRERLTVVIPVTLLLILLLLCLNTRSAVKTFIVLLAVPFSAVGAIWLLYLLGYNMSIVVWVVLIALLGVDAETGVFMLLYLDLAYEQARKEGRLSNADELRAAIYEGAVGRLRPKFMTVTTTFIGLVPIMWATGAGADVMKRIAAPMVGGILTSFLLELLVYPCIYEIWKWNFTLRRGSAIPRADEAPAV